MQTNPFSRRKFIKTAAVAGAGTLLMNNSIMAAPSVLKREPTLNGKKVLWVYGGWEGHDPKKCTDLFVPWMREEGAEVTVSDTMDSYLDEDLMSSVDLIVQIMTMSDISDKQVEMLLKTVKNGTGLAGWHGGIGDAFRTRVEFQFMVGGQWVAHPGGVIDYRVNITNHEDFVTKGLKDFDMNSEQYYMHVDPNVKVLATTTYTGEHASWIDGGVMPVVWKKYYGTGRVFYSSLGHVVEDFEVPQALEIQKRGFRWAAESKYMDFEKWLTPIYKNI